MTDYQMLISRFLYDELDDAQQAELNAWLAADPANADLFMREAFVNRHFMERRLIDDAVITLAEHLPAEPTVAEVAAAKTEAEQLMPVSAPAPIFKIGIRLAGVAAAAVLLITTALPLLTGSSDDGRPNGPDITRHDSIDQMLEAEWARLTGDITHDRVVDISDFYALEGNAGRTTNDGEHNVNHTGNGEIVLRDFAKLQRAFGTKGLN